MLYRQINRSQNNVLIESFQAHKDVGKTRNTQITAAILRRYYVIDDPMNDSRQVPPCKRGRYQPHMISVLPYA